MGMHKCCAGYAEAAIDMRWRPALTPAECDIELAAKQFMALPDERFMLICLSGELWLTRDGDRQDYILGPGQSLAIRRRDLAAVQALKPSRLRLLPQVQD